MDIATTAADGTCEVVDGRYVLRFERRFDQSLQRVWKGISEPDEMARWLSPQATVPELVAGNTIELRWNEEYLERAKITRCEAPTLLEVDGDIHGMMRWELREDGEETVLSFTGECPEEKVAFSLGGWHIHLDMLETALYLDPEGPRWKQLKEEYAARMP
jgi:uncharacterized protein YndB with AHSA1/START domain